MTIANVSAWSAQTPHKIAQEALARFKWSIFPVDASKQPVAIPGKFKDSGEPMRLGWKKYQSELPHAQALDSWQHQFKPAAWAVITGKVSGIVVLDFDGEPGQKTLAQLGIGPHVRTGSGGFHAYFQHPGWSVATLNSKSKRELGNRWPGLDIRADGGYAVFCGNNAHGSYIWLKCPEPYPLDMLPDNLRDFLGLLHAPESQASTRRQEQETRPHPSPARRPGRSIAEVLLDKYVQEAAVQGRDNACFALACQLRDNNCPESEAKIYAREFARLVPNYNTKGQHEPFTESDAEKKVESAYKGSVRQPWKETPHTFSPRYGDDNAPPGSPSGCSGRPSSFNCTDLGNAERFAARYPDKARWCETWNAWLVFNGKCWETDKTGRADQLAKAAVRAIYKEASEELDDTIRTKIAKHAAASESNRAIRAMLERAKSELPATPNQFNNHLHLLNCNNGTVDLRTGNIQSHNYRDMLTRCLKVDYNPLAIAPLWNQLVSSTFDGDTSLVDFLQTALGMSLSGDIREQCWFLCHGDGNNGKSTLLETVRILLEDYGLAANIESFLARKDERNYDKAEFYGKRMITASEIPPKSRLNEAFIKKITGGEDIRAARKFENEFQFTPECTIWLSVNHRPIVKDTSKGMWRRVRYIPFNVTIPDEQVDTTLPKRLLAEADGILAWLIQGCIKWYQQGRLIVPDVVKDATQRYRAEQDIISQFIGKECDFQPGARTTTQALTARFEQWCEQEQEKPDTGALKEALHKKGYRSQRGQGGKYVWVGIELKESDADADTAEQVKVVNVGERKGGKVLTSDFSKEKIGDSGSPTFTTFTNGLETQPNPAISDEIEYDEEDYTL